MRWMGTSHIDDQRQGREVYILRGDWVKAAEMAEQAAEIWQRAAEKGRISG
jgi:hypothetical protein